MKGELSLLYGDVAAGEVTTVEEFRRRLEAIELVEREGDSEVNLARAVRAFAALQHEAPSRHHQLELLSDALGIT